MSLISMFRSITPDPVWQTLGFFKRLPAYWKVDRSDFLRVKNNAAPLALYLNSKVFVVAPEDITAYICWRNHALEDKVSSIEVYDFVELSQDRHALIDIGSQTGFMSALFARSRKGPSHILSMEPDPQVHSILERTRQLNSLGDTDWTILQEAVSDTSGSLSLPISNTLYSSKADPLAFGTLIQVPSRTLPDLVASLDWTPDIIKIDVESFEYEILTSSLELLAEIKPALQLEVHWQILKDRKLDALDFLKPLYDMGYRGIRSRYRGISDWKREGQQACVTRLALK